MHPRLQQIVLSGNRLGRNGCIALATLLKCSCNELHALHLDNNEINDEGIDALVPALKNCTELDGIYIDNNTSITSRGFQSLATILEAPDSNLNNLYALGINRNNIDDKILAIFIDALENNNTLVRLSFLDGNQVTAKGWEALSKLLCDYSSVNSAFRSNHTLYDLGVMSDENMSQDLVDIFGPDLHLNETDDKNAVAMTKIYGRNLDMSPFFEWEFKILPLMINWLERAFRKVFAAESESIKREAEAENRSMQLSCIYQFVRDMPLLCVENQLRKELDGIKAELDFGLCPWHLRGEERELLSQRKRQLEARKRNILEILGRW